MADKLTNWKLLPLVSLLFFCGVARSADNADEADQPAPVSNSVKLLAIGDQVPAYPAAAEWIYGGEQKMAEFDGKKLLLLYFGKPGCSSCDEFAPHLYRLLLKYRDVLKVVMITPGIFPQADVVEYAANRKLGDYPIMRDPENEFYPRFIGRITKFPAAALISDDGKLVWFGRAKFHEKITEEIDRALGKKTAENLPAPSAGAAVVIGVGDPPTLPESLVSPLADAARVAAALEKRGYAVSLFNKNVTKEQVFAALQDARAQIGETGQLIVFFSGDAIEIDGGANLAFALNDSDVSLAELAAPDNRGVFIVDAAQIDAFEGINNAPTDGRVFTDTIKKLGESFPDATILLSTARWDKSLIMPDGTLFAHFLVNMLDSGAENIEEITRDITLALAAQSRLTGDLQTPAKFGKNVALWKNPEK